MNSPNPSAEAPPAAGTSDPAPSPPKPAAAARASRRAVKRAFVAGALVLCLTAAGLLWWFAPWQRDMLASDMIDVVPTSPLLRSGAASAASAARMAQQADAVPAAPAASTTSAASAVSTTSTASVNEPAASPHLETALAAPVAPMAPVPSGESPAAAPEQAALPPRSPSRSVAKKAQARDARCSDLLARQSLGEASASQLSIQWKCQ